MDGRLMGKAMLIAWAQMGIEIVDIKENDDKLVFYITVPKDTIATRSISTNGNKMAGEYLAKRIKETTSAILGTENFSVKYKVRDEIWDDAKIDVAEKRVKKELGIW